MDPLDDVAFELEMEGFVPGTPDFERALRFRKIARCQDYNGVRTCRACQKAMFCKTLEEHTKLERQRLEEEMAKQQG